MEAFLALFLPWALTHLRSEISFAVTDPIGDTIGGIAGLVFNFAGLLVMHFSFARAVSFQSNSDSEFYLAAAAEQ